MRVLQMIFLVAFCMTAGAASYHALLDDGKTQMPTPPTYTKVITLAPKPTESVEPTKEPVREESYPVTEEERYWLAKIAMAEAEDQDLEGKALVVCVVMNRVRSSSWANSVKEVIYQPKQFSPVWNGRWDAVEPTESCYKAVDMVMSGWDKSQGALYFRMRSEDKTLWHYSSLTFLFGHGDHDFFK